MIGFLFFFLSVASFAQEFRYQLEGSFIAPDEVTVNYNLNWNETSSEIQGIYRDNFYAKDGPQLTSGSVDSGGRSLRVILPEAINGVQTIVVDTTQTGNTNASVSTKVSVLSPVGAVLATHNGFALLEADISNSAATNNNNCMIGFGALTGYCGTYSGIMTEVNDNNFRCNLTITGQPKLELAPDTSLKFHISRQESHTIGALTLSPLSGFVNIVTRYCDALAGTTFPSNNCKTLNLTGTFFNQVDTYTFNGTYSISDEVTANSCNYRMALTRERTL